MGKGYTAPAMELIDFPKQYMYVPITWTLAWLWMPTTYLDMRVRMLYTPDEVFHSGTLAIGSVDYQAGMLPAAAAVPPAP